MTQYSFSLLYTDLSYYVLIKPHKAHHVQRKLLDTV